VEAGEAARRAFIEAHTAVEAPPAVPEIVLHLAALVTPLWESTADWLDARGVEPPYWAFAWAGGQALARHVLDHPEDVRGKRVLDFGAGSGLVGIAASKAGAARVVSCDLDRLALSACSLNARLNGVELEQEIEDRVGDVLDGWDTILVGDMFYEAAALRIAPWLKSLSEHGKTVLVGDPGRSYLPADLLEVGAMEIATSLDLEATASKRVAVYRLG
jgi:predicted nicotinamide N-methyase